MGETSFKALLVGNGTFPKDPHELPDLSGPAADLRVLQEAFTHPELGLYQPDQVTTLLDRTRGEILEHLEAFFSESSRDDQLLLYYSGHGRLDAFSNLYLCAADTRTNLLVSTGISDEQINAILRNSPSSRIVIVLDCCHSGRFKGVDLPRHLTGEGRFVLTSSRARELSVDAAQPGAPSAFTRHLAGALLSEETDSDQDGFVSLNEIYNYVLPRLNAETRQTPQRSFDRTVADLPLGRSRTRRAAAAAAPDLPARAGDRPVLAVSEESIEIEDVKVGEALPPEVVDVFNQGGGALDWTVTCEEDWVQVTPAKGFFTIVLSPRPGTNRARIHVRDRGLGGSKTVRLRVEVEDVARAPRLVLSETEIDFGELPAGAKVPPRVVRLQNAGGGELRPAVARSPEWLEVRLFGEVVEIAPREGLQGAGAREGAVAIASSGGDAEVRVRLSLGQGPVLAVKPPKVYFGAVSPGAHPTARVLVVNAGGGELTWSFKQSGDFFTVARDAHGLTLSLDAGVGSHQGAVLVTSNGGDATVEVKAKVKGERPAAPAPAPVPPPLPVPPSEIVPGRWQVEMNAFGLVSSQMLLDLYPTGQLAGQQTLMGLQAPIAGAWGYDRGSRVLSLQLMAQVMGMPTQDFRQVLITGRQGEVLSGQDGNGLTYQLRRIG